jgi:hypothetical protein
MIIENSDNQWWNNEESKKNIKKDGVPVVDTDYFHSELLKIEEALHNLARILKKYQEE